MRVGGSSQGGVDSMSERPPGFLPHGPVTNESAPSARPAGATAVPTGTPHDDTDTAVHAVYMFLKSDRPIKISGVLLPPQLKGAVLRYRGHRCLIGQYHTFTSNTSKMLLARVSESGTM